MFNDENFIDDIMKMGEQRKRQKGAAFIGMLREQFMRDTEENISKLYTRDKGDATFKLCKMKSGYFSIIDNVTKETLFSSYNLHESKVEFILKQSLASDMGANIFNKASGL